MSARRWMVASIALVSTYAWACGDSGNDGSGPSGAGTGEPMAGTGSAASSGGAAGHAGTGAMMPSGSAGSSGSQAGTGGSTAGAAGMNGVAGMAGAGSSGPFLPFGPDAYQWSTDKFMLGPGEERYLCFAKSIDEDLVVNAYASKGDRFVHHLIFARTRQPEPEGFAECDVAFRSNWDQIYITGTGENRLEFPADAGHVMPKGQQLLAQMHLLNASTAPVEGTVTIHMRRSTVANPRPVSAYIFGTAAVDLPPAETSQVVGTCSPFGAVQLIAGFPHMHKLGAAMKFEVGPSETELKEIYARDPFDFDDQHIDKLDLMIPGGNVTRVTCTFDNTRDQKVGYGESTLDEMCYFVGFAVGGRGGACIEVLPPNIFGN